jgi:hypothetical protein
MDCACVARPSEWPLPIADRCLHTFLSFKPILICCSSLNPSPAHSLNTTFPLHLDLHTRTHPLYRLLVRRKVFAIMETSEKPYGLSYLSLCLVLLSFIVSLAYRAFYNLYRHPLAHIPGPKLAASTYLYQTYFSLVGGSRYYIQIAEMHRKYGRRGH